MVRIESIRFQTPKGEPLFTIPISPLKPLPGTDGNQIQSDSFHSLPDGGYSAVVQKGEGKWYEQLFHRNTADRLCAMEINPAVHKQRLLNLGILVIAINSVSFPSTGNITKVRI